MFDFEYTFYMRMRKEGIGCKKDKNNFKEKNKQLSYAEHAVKNKSIIKDLLCVSAIFILCVIAVLLEFAYVQKFTYGFIYEYRKTIMTVCVLTTVLFSAISVFWGLKDSEFVLRLCFLTLLTVVVIFTALYLFEVSGLLDKVDSVEDFREFISHYGSFAVPVFLLLQILQVVVLPIPGIIAIGAGVALFGAFWGGLYSFIGITLGSFIAFFIGRKFGYKAASWLVGEKALGKALNSVKGKDKVVLTVMFILPFFPDDVLCFVAGLSSMSKAYFFVMIIITRIISSFTTAYSVDGKIIPYNTLGGIIVWALLIAAAFILAGVIYKKCEVIEKKIKDFLCKKSIKTNSDRKIDR